ncbi:hypothetical protein NDR87_10715 [Nocardia sp. CDC159]|uniref:PPE family protein n=1 Tax=Nocardia pulmonis TaxID=2951408 RepID=A0A9X2E4E9_9NOCA|nr:MULTISPECIES: hypothetical protein [Nocardia]MCM6773942.1 hypothetical protein [Nocardia pulmonis]MCM6786829.1 hypothetical protein [Nocardia sp. CDC159]
MSSYEDYQRRIIEAQDQWNQERQRIYGQTQALNSTFQGDFDPLAINYCEVYDGMSLEAMRKCVNDMRPDQLRAAAEVWSKIGTELTAASNAFNSEFAKTVNGDGAHAGWTGQSASAAVRAVNNYSDRSHDLVSAAQLIALKLAELHTGLEQTQALFPGVDERPTVVGKTLSQDGVMKADDYSKEEQTEEARRILRTVYGQVVVQADRGVPVLPMPPKIAEGAPVEPVGPGGNQWPGGTSGLGDGTENGGGDGKPGDPTEQSGDKPGDDPTRNPETQAASTTPSSASDSTSPGNTTGTAGAQPGSGTSTTPAGSGGTSSSGSTGTTGYGGFARGGSGGGTGGGTSGRGGSTGGAPGRGIPGVPGTSGTPGVVPAAARLTGMPGQPNAGMPGMGAPGAAAKKDDEDRTKSTPDYLVTKEHGEELIGPNTKAVPPVIGGDYDRA